MKRALVVVALTACGADTPPHATPAPVASDGATARTSSDPLPTQTGAPSSSEVWLRGSTHVHGRPSGDSTTSIPDVIAWYEAHAYDFIVLTDHNQVSELEPRADTSGQVAVRNPPSGLIVLAGIELTNNPSDCLPVGDPSGRCRIHVNLLGTSTRPGGKVDWADRESHERIAKYQAAIVAARTLGGIAQLNHPQWFWGMTPDLLVEIAKRGIRLVEVANVQFTKWNAGDTDHPSTEALWDAALVRGAALWAVASDDAHDYSGSGGKYPAGGGWVMVKARREPQAILDALAAGHFYASTGVTLDRAEVVSGELVIEVAASELPVTIEFIENGKVVASLAAKSARRSLPPRGYLRANVVRGDGKRAWVQPARR